VRGLCLGVTSVPAVGGPASPAGAQEGPSVTAFCDLGSFGEYGFLGFTGLPPNESLTFLAVANGPQRIEVFNIPFVTDANGVSLSGRSPERDANRPVNLGVSVYRDLNGNGQWDAEDDTLFRGSGTLVDCPSQVPIGPK
jgi:hypothetical protein